jgi:ADP-ribosylglycohydrolase
MCGLRESISPSEGAITGCVLGTAVGDALGLPCEGLTPERQRRLFPDTARYHFLLGRGMVSDDTDHTCLVGQSLLESAGEPDRFERALARHLRLWLVGLPAGIGLATLRATARLCAGVPPTRSGVRSAGNGPAMRSALIGVCYGDDPAVLTHLVRRCTRLTHTDPKAEVGALAVAVAAHVSATTAGVSADAFRASFAAAASAAKAHGASQNKDGPLEAAIDEFLTLFERAAAGAAAGQSAEAFADSIGLRGGVSGYVYHAVPAVLQVWLRLPDDFAGGVTDIIRAGGDSDSTGAILGALIGARVGPDGIPAPWVDGLWEWPRSVEWMGRLGAELARMRSGQTPSPVRVAGWQIPLRNALFTGAVLAHGLRRTLPPY